MEKRKMSHFQEIIFKTTLTDLNCGRNKNMTLVTIEEDKIFCLINIFQSLIFMLLFIYEKGSSFKIRPIFKEKVYLSNFV